MYTTYCANHPIAVQTIVKLEDSSPEFKNFLKVCPIVPYENMV